MNDTKRIILPGDAGWSGPLAAEVGKTEVPKLPNEVLEAAFTEVVGEVQEALTVQAEDISTPDTVPAATEPVPPPGPSYKFHRPAQKKMIDVPVPKPIEATLLADLPRRWERVCYQQFRKDGKITLTGMVFVPGLGAMYEFAEGKRGSYCVRPDQVSFSMPEVDDASVLVSQAETLLPEVKAEETI